jgi:hypothetical protein
VVGGVAHELVVECDGCMCEEVECDLLKYIYKY